MRNNLATDENFVTEDDAKLCVDYMRPHLQALIDYAAAKHKSGAGAFFRPGGRVLDADGCVLPGGSTHMEPVPVRSEPAQGLVEFGLLLALVAVVAIAGLLVFGTTVSDLISTLSHTVSLNLSL